MKDSRFAPLMAAALSLGAVANLFALQPPGEGPREGRSGRPPEGPPPGERFRPVDSPPPRGGDFNDEYGPPRGPGMRPDGPPGPGGPHGPGGRPGPDGPPPLTPMEQRDETLRSLLNEEAQLRGDCERVADEARRDAAKAEELRTLVTRHFDIRHDIRARKVELLEQELQALKDSLTKRQERKQDLVEDRLSELLGKPSPIDF